MLDAGNAVIWEAFTSTNQIYVIAGIVDDGYSGDGGAATQAEVNYPLDCVPDKNNNVFIADFLNSRVREITEMRCRRQRYIRNIQLS